MLTEQEAREKWCPMARVALCERPPQGEPHFLLCHGLPAYNATVIGGTHQYNHKVKCIASGCMMWRWASKPNTVDERNNSITTIGYCGLAGKPDA